MNHKLVSSESPSVVETAVHHNGRDSQDSGCHKRSKKTEIVPYRQPVTAWHKTKVNTTATVISSHIDSDYSDGVSNLLVETRIKNVDVPGFKCSK